VRPQRLSIVRLFVVCFPIVACGSRPSTDVEIERAAVTTPSFVQVNAATPQSTPTTVAITYTAAQTAGDLNVVIVGWNDTTASVASINDSKGNSYQLAIGPTRSGSESQSIYYAKNILAATAGANTVTVTFSPAAAFPDVRIVEYKGIDTTSPLDVSVGNVGSSNSSNSGSVTTTNATDLLVAGNIIATGTTGAGTGFTKRLITTPDADIIEDRVVTAVGSNSATAPLAPAGAWVMQMVAFRAAGSAPDTTPPTAPTNLTATAASGTQINLSWTAATDNVAVTSYLVESCQGASCSTFAQIGTTAGTTFNATGLTAGTSYSFRVRATDAASNLGPYSAVATATTTAPDTTPPTAPSNLTATTISNVQINVAWTAATDNVGVTSYLVERCQGASCSNFAQIGTTAGTAMNVTGLTAGTSYSFRVRATDAAGNLGSYSNVASATTTAPDSTPPTAPSSLAGTGTSNTQIGLTWTAATDNVGVTSYLVERCLGAACSNFAQVGTSTVTSFSDSGLTSATTYSYRVRASDAVGNLGPYSNVATATTTSAPPPPPGFVQGNYATPQSASNAAVAATFNGPQTAGNLNVVVVGWNDATGKVASISDSAGNSYVLAVGPTVGSETQSIYYAKNIAATTTTNNTVTVTFSPSAAWVDMRILEYQGLDQSGPLDAVQSATGSSTSSTTPNIVTTSAVDIIVAGNTVATGVTGPGAGFTTRFLTVPDSDIVEDRNVSSAGSYAVAAGIAPSGAWVMQAVAFRAASNGPDTTPPSAPTNLVATAISATQINLGWSASVDNIGVVSYSVESCAGASCTSFAPIGTSSTTTFSSTGLTAGTTYSFRVRAADAANNLSGYSATASATTTAPDTTPPTAPSNLVATAASGSQINLGWTAATDNVGVTGYLVERCAGASCTSFAQVGATAATVTTYNDTGLAAGTSYSYRVRATDAAGNLGAYSATASATTTAPDTTPPTAPSNLTANSGSNTQVNVTWTGSTDDVGVTGYFIERCQGATCANFAQVGTSTGTTFSDTGLTAATAYSYRVRAGDAAGNLSAYSGVATATTAAVPPPPPAFVQGNYSCPQSPSVGTVTVAFTQAQTAGNLNVIVVGANDATSQVSFVSDSAGNVYTLAVGPTVGTETQSIYYAKNIAPAAGGNNVVTISFSPAAAWPDVRIAEYQGLDPNNPLDAVSSSTGNSTSANTPNIVTTNPVDMIVAADTVATTTTGAGGGYITRIMTVPDADIFEDWAVNSARPWTVSAPVSPAGNWVMQAVAFKASSSTATPPGQDTNPPTVSITSPAAGATLTGTATVTVAASDAETSVVGVVLLVDGLSMGAPVNATPYTMTLDTTKLANGAHTISASAWDVANNIGTAAPVSVTVNNATAGNPAQTGLWSGVRPLPIVSINTTLTYNGKILMSEGQSWGPDTRLWDPLTGTAVSVGAPSNIFCSTGLEQLGDGRIFVAGGHLNQADVGVTNANIFDPATLTWTQLPEMTYPRWYPQAAILPDGRQLVVSGEINCDGCVATVPEIYNPVTNAWTQLSGATQNIPFYPHLHVLPDGRVLAAATARLPIVSTVFDVNALTWTNIGGNAVDGGSSAQYAPGKIIKMGTSNSTGAPTQVSATTAYVLDTTQSSPNWRKVGSMQFGRTYHVATVLPDGTVLVTGGGPTGAPTDTANAVLAAEIWSPTTENWTTMSSMHAPRLYHSEALLMPDARVLITGGGRADDVSAPTDQFSAEFFSPPYLFKGPRPTITSAPNALQYGQPFTVTTPDAARIASVSIVRLGSTTHAFNGGQHYVPLTFAAGSGTLTVTAPANSNIATPGFYMLFIVDSNGVPSTATFLHF
jgi:chitodextrinase